MRTTPSSNCHALAGKLSIHAAAASVTRSAITAALLILATNAACSTSENQAMDAATETTFDAGSSDATPIDAAPWPPEELMRETDPQPTGDGWRTAQWNVCTTGLDGGRIECRAKIAPEDSTRTAAQLERAAIAKMFTEDANLYSFTLQEICEQDARWIASFVANGGPPVAGWNREFTRSEYERLDELAPYAFVPYFTREMLGTRDLGCGPGYSTGVAVIAKRMADTSGLKLLGFTNASYEERAKRAFEAADLLDPDVCSYYFDRQTSYARTGGGDTGPYDSVSNFRSAGCVSPIPDTVRGIACVRTRWQGPGDSTSYRVSTCATHAVHKGTPTAIVRNHQIDEAGRRIFEFAGGTDQRSILSGDFNVVPYRGATASLNTAERGHATILTESNHGFGKVTVGNHDTSANTGTIRGGSCGREIDAIYAKNAWWLLSGSPNQAICRDFPEEEPPAIGPAADPYEWSDHEMTVSPLMAPHGSGAADL